MATITTLSLNPAIDVSSEAAFVTGGQKIRTANDVFDAGGGGVNVARVITELGGDAEVICLAGGVTGDLLDEFLTSGKVRHQLIKIEGTTRISFTVHDRSSGLEYRFVARGPTVHDSELESMIRVVRSRNFQYLLASGSLPPGAPDDMFATVSNVAREKGARFVLDSSGPGLQETLARTSVFLVKPSLEELESLVGSKLDEPTAREAARELVQRGKAEIVAVTMGARGVVCVTKEKTFRLAALDVLARSTVGAGDSFLGAVTWGLAVGKGLDDCLRLGIAAGAAALLHPGTRLCRRADVERLYGEALKLAIRKC
jgi:6-phosphofructokinase 2